MPVHASSLAPKPAGTLPVGTLVRARTRTYRIAAVVRNADFLAFVHKKPVRLDDGDECFYALTRVNAPSERPERGNYSELIAYLRDTTGAEPPPIARCQWCVHVQQYYAVLGHVAPDDNVPDLA